MSEFIEEEKDLLSQKYRLLQHNEKDSLIHEFWTSDSFSDSETERKWFLFLFEVFYVRKNTVSDSGV